MADTLPTGMPCSLAPKPYERKESNMIEFTLGFLIGVMFGIFGALGMVHYGRHYD